MKASTAPQPRCVITGAAAGIGRALALRCAAAGYAVVGIDYDAEQAARTQAELIDRGASATFVQADLADPAAIERLVNQLAAAYAPLDLLVHNAGISAVGRFAATDLHSQQAVLDVNLLAPMLLTAGLLRKHALAAGSTLVFLSSLSHYVGYPGAAAYAASKDGLASYARSLAVHLAAQQIHVLTVFPGPTRTAHARRYSPDNRREARRMPPETLAAAIMQAVAARRRTLIAGRGNQLAAWLGYLLPGLMDRVMKRAILDRLTERT